MLTLSLVVGKNVEYLFFLILEALRVLPASTVYQKRDLFAEPKTPPRADMPGYE